MELQSKIKKTIVFITHDLDEALRLGDRIAILKDGKVVQIGTPEEILMDPADEYVKDFTQDVNRLRVLTAANAMYDPITVIGPRGGPRVAIEAMSKQGLSSVFVIDRERRLQGIVTLDDAVEAAKQKVSSIESLLINDIPIAHPDDTLDDMLPLAASSRFPIAVLDEERKLLGIIPRVAVISALAGDSPNYQTGDHEVEVSNSSGEI
jgi:glycine betaine/proline transport system ATP-binding protein